MRGGYLHNNFLIRPVEGASRFHGARTHREVHVITLAGPGFIDLVAEWEDRIVAVEAELTPRRVRHDVAKAAAVGASELWIIVPTWRIAGLIRRALERVEIEGSELGVFVLTVGQARERVTECFPLFSASNEPEKQFPESLATTRSAIP